MIQGPFKDPVSHMCLAGAVVASWSLTQDVAGWSPFKVCPHRAAAANTKSMEASTQASSGTFEVCRLPLGVG